MPKTNKIPISAFNFRNSACLLTLATFGIYLFALTQRSLWLDEGVTLARVSSTWARALDNVVPIQGLNIIDEHPPLYYLTLKCWMSLTGSGEFSLKFLSALVCALATPLAYATGKQTYGAKFGLVFAAFVGACPGIFWQATQLRAYAFAVPLSVTALYFLLRAFAPFRPRRFMIALIVIAIGVLVNYFFLAVFGGAWVSLALFILNRDLKRKPFKPSLGLLAVLALSASVGLAFAVVRPSFGGLLQNILEHLRALQWTFNSTFFQQLSSGSLFGQNAGDFSGGMFTLAGLAAAGLGWLLPARNASSTRANTFLGALPFVMSLFGLSLVFEGTATYRYVIIAAPAFFYLITRAVFALRGRGLWRGLMAFGLGASVLGAEMFGAVSTLTPSPTWQDDWRSLSQHIHANWQDDDEIVIRDIYTPDQVMKLYLGNLNAPLTPASQWQPGALSTRRVWLVNTGAQDPADIQNGAFTRLWQRDLTRFGGWSNTLELRLYETRPPVLANLPTSAMPVAIPPGGAGDKTPALTAYETRTGSQQALYPGVWLTTYWKNNGANDPSQFNLSARLLSGGQAWAAAQMPARLGALNGWADGYARVEYRIPTPVGLPIAPYDLQITVLRGEKNEPAAVYTLPQETNTWRIPSHPAALPATPVWSSPSATLLAAEFEREAHPGAALALALTWQKNNPLRENWDTAMWIKPLPFGAAINPDHTQKNKVLAGSPARQMLSAKIPETAAPGWYRVGVDRFADDEQNSIDLGLIQVSPYPIRQLPDAPTHPATAQVGEFSLLGYRLDQPFERGVTLNFYTYWQATAQPKQDGVLFLFVLGADGKLVSQDDNPPEGRSTLTFRAGEGIKQPHRIVLPNGAPAGTYHLYAGIYNRADIERWQATQNGAPAKDNLADLSTIELK